MIFLLKPDNSSDTYTSAGQDAGRALTARHGHEIGDAGLYYR